MSFRKLRRKFSVKYHIPHCKHNADYMVDKSQINLAANYFANYIYIYVELTGLATVYQCANCKELFADLMSYAHNT